MRMWETIPGVIRNNATDACRVEVNVNGAVTSVTMTVWQRFTSESGQTNVTLRDDGLGGDRVAGDFIYTSELIRYNTNYSSGLPTYYEYDTNSPAGLMPESIGTVTVTETNGTQSQFLINPEVGILSASIPLTLVVQLSSNVVVSPHLLNVVGTNLFVQKLLRQYSYETGELPGKIYSVFPDAFDFLVYFSTYRIEWVPANAYDQIAGVHQSIQVNYTGTGQAEFNDSALYGSQGRLLGVNALDAYDRGILSGICTHEILHQWASFMPAFPFSDGEHYVRTSNLDSLLGGGLWDDNGDGTWTLDCKEQAYGPTRLDVFDQYLMGLVATNLVTPLRVYAPTSIVYCGGIVSNLVSVVTIEDIVNTYGQRTPGPATAKRDFSVGFVAESNQRLLNQVEMTYYEAFAAHYTKAIPAEQADPLLLFGWAPITRFFGPSTSWSSEVMALIQPVIQSLTHYPDGHCQITAEGLPGWNYALEGSTDLQTWAGITNQVAGTNGTVVLTDVNSNRLGAKFYRLVLR